MDSLRHTLPRIRVLISHVELAAPPSRLALEVQSVLTAYAGVADIRVADVQFADALSSAQSAERDHEVDVFVCAGATGAYLRAHLSTPVVLMPVTGYDVIYALEKARRLAQSVVILSYRRPIAELTLAPDLLTVQCRQETYTTLAQAEQRVDTVFAEGFEVVVGSSMVTEIAARRGLKGILINSPISIQRALDEAIAMARGARAEAARQYRFRTILESLDEGVMMVGAQRSVVAANAVFAQFVDAAPADIVGRPVSEVAPQFGVDEVLRTGQSKMAQVLSLGKHTLVCSITPVPEEDGLTGAMVIVQDAAVVQRAERQIRSETRQRAFTATYRLSDITGTSKKILDLIDLAKRYARSDATVLITGESGTGKELFAQGIHNESHRAGRPFVAINCAGFPEALLESELFGYEEGAFTGSRKGGKPGLFEIAHTGTVFLDEIGEMPLALQTRLLRVLQAREVVRLGGTQPTPIDVRVIAATHRDLFKRITEDEFRQDLFYRLNILRLKLPPLRERAEDLPLLAESILRRIGAGKPMRAPIKTIIDSLSAYLARCQWPGNVRELENVMERAAVVFSDAAEFDGTPSGPDLMRAMFDDDEVLVTGLSDTSAVQVLNHSKQKLQLLQIIDQCDGNLTEAAKKLGINRSTLWRRLKVTARD